MRSADWYFDFVSPYSYFGLVRLEEVTGLTDVCYRPVLFAGLLKHWDQKGPAEIPAKRVWTYRWCTWWAKQHGIPFCFPAVHPFNPLPYLRLAIAADNSHRAIKLIFEALWTTGVDPADDRVLEGLAASLKISLSRLAEPDVKDALRRNTKQALTRNVFGVPTLVVDGQQFWGADATPFAKAYLDDPEIFAGDEMKRVTTLPVGAVRERH